MFDDTALFIHIVQKRGLSATATYLNLPPATVSRRLQKLEHNLGCQLIHRSARKFSLTAEGEVYYNSYAGLVQQFEATARNLSTDRHQLSGKLNVFAPTNAAIGVLRPLLSDFVRAFPEIQLDLNLSNETKDILDGQVDLAFRIGPQKGSKLFQKRLGSIATLLVASPDYLAQHGTPKTLNDLHQHKLIAVRTLPKWTMHDATKDKVETFRLSPTTMVDDISMARHFASDGLGISLLPASEIASEVERGSLIQVLPYLLGPPRDVFAIWPSGRLLSARAKCLRDFAQERIAKLPVLQGAIPQKL